MTAQIIPISDPSLPLATGINPGDLFLLDQVDVTQITGYKTKKVPMSTMFGSGITVTAAFTGGPVIPYVVSPTANGVWISGTNSPGLSVTSVDFAGTYYAQEWIQFTTGQDVSIAETGFGINGTFQTGWAATNTSAEFKQAFGIWTKVLGKGTGHVGAGQVWNFTSDMIIDSTYGASPNNTNNFAANIEFDIQNNGWDASPGNAVGSITNLFLAGFVGAFPITAEIWIAPSGGSSSNYASHYGVFCQGNFTIKDNTFYDTTNSNISFLDQGTHLYGVNLSGTYSTAQIAATGFVVLPSGAITSANHTGGTAAGSTLLLQSTSNGSPSGDSVTIKGSTISWQNIAGTTRFLDYNLSNAGFLTIGGAGTISGLAMNALQIVQAGNIATNTAAGPAVLNAAASATQPTLVPRQSDLKAGIGADAAGDVSIIADIGGTATEMFRISGALTAFGKLVTAASTTARSSFNIPSGTAPTSPTDGDMWYDGTTVKFRVGATTKTFTLT